MQRGGELYEGQNSPPTPGPLVPRGAREPGGPRVADLAPWRARPPGPHQHQNGADWQNDIPCEYIACETDGENREDSERPESAQASRETIVGRRRGSRFARKFKNLFRRFRRLACHAEIPPLGGCRSMACDSTLGSFCGDNRVCCP